MGKIHDWAQYYTYIADCARKKGYTTASQLAHGADVSESILSKIKTGESKSPAFDTIYSICEASGASLDVMCGIKSDASEEVAELRRQHEEEVAELRKELDEQKQANTELNHQNELLTVHIEEKTARIESLRTSKKLLLKWLTIVSTILAVFTILFIALLIYDKMNPHMGWFTAFNDLKSTLKSF